MQEPSKHQGQYAQIQGEVVTGAAFPGNSPSSEGLYHRGHGGGEEQKWLKRKAVTYGPLCLAEDLDTFSCQVAILV